MFARALLLPILCFCGCAGALPPAAPQSANPALTIAAIAGCFDTQLSDWDPPLTEQLPSSIELSKSRIAQGFGKGDHALKTMIATPGLQERTSFWRVGDSKLELVWTDGFAGVTAALLPAGRDFAGTAMSFSDAGLAPPSRAQLKLQRIPCSARRKVAG